VISVRKENLFAWGEVLLKGRPIIFLNVFVGKVSAKVNVLTSSLIRWIRWILLSNLSRDFDDL